MKPILKINFSDFWPGFDYKRNYFFELLSLNYTVQLTDKPDILFYSVYGKDYLNYSCYRICFTPENERLDFTGFDYGLGFDYMEHPDYMRLPLYSVYLDGDFSRISKKGLDPEAIYKQKTRFCNMIVSNPNSPKRVEFFDKLCKYKKVDSGGRYMNNIGGPVNDKEAFIRQYKFTFAFENSSFPGYTTEKLVQPMKVQSMPIYWGNPRVAEEFNTRSFVNWHDYENDEQVIEQIIALDGNKDLYLQYLQEEYITNQQVLQQFNRESIVKVFEDILYRARHSKPKALTQAERIHKLKNKKKTLFFLVKKALGIKHFR
jgi:alpha(1,3/1,4) fucosyltransferase